MKCTYVHPISCNLHHTTLSSRINACYITPIPHRTNRFIHQHILLVGPLPNTDGVSSFRRIDSILDLFVICPTVIINGDRLSLRSPASRRQQQQQHQQNGDEKATFQSPVFSEHGYHVSPIFGNQPSTYFIRLFKKRFCGLIFHALA